LQKLRRNSNKQHSKSCHQDKFWLQKLVMWKAAFSAFVKVTSQKLVKNYNKHNNFVCRGFQSVTSLVEFVEGRKTTNAPLVRGNDFFIPKLDTCARRWLLRSSFIWIDLNTKMKVSPIARNAHAWEVN
jgi:hypothetical protein